MKPPFKNSLPAGRRAARAWKAGVLAAVLMIALLSFHGSARAQSNKAELRDLARQRTLYVVGYAHLDTQWRWEYPQVIQEYLSKTMRNNFALFEKYPHYIFNFTGANRYMMMKEYYPSDYAKLKRYVALGRWFPAGSSMEENDVNSPSAESILRQVLYGNEFFRHEFGKASEEYMLPDCFGFPASLPSILAHAGIKGFSTQKLSAGWQPAPHVGGPDSPEKTPEGIAFNVGLWEGPDGKTVMAALNPSGYGSQVLTDLSKDNTTPGGRIRTNGYVYDWPDRVNLDGNVTGVYADYHYVGTGDTGGSPNESSVKLMESIMTKGKAVLPAPSVFREEGTVPPPTSSPVQVGNGPLRVIWSDADQMFRDIKPGETARMPRYKGDLELINHSAGSITSQAYHKRWNRENEVLADAAEEASVTAAWLGGRAYPQERLNHAWRLVLGGQFHDLMAGTATPRSYEFTWNDDVIAMNQFAGVITSATQTVASALNTQVQGTPIVVYNSLNIPRQDVVEAKVAFPGGVPKAVRVVGPDGRGVPAQLEGVGDTDATVVFAAEVPSVGYAVYDVQPAESTFSSSELQVSDTSLENSRYRVKIDEQGDVSSIFDKKLNRELLSAPIRFVILTDNPEHYPAWNMDFDDEQRPPRAMVGGPAKIQVVENGPARVALAITRQAENSEFTETIRLAAGDAGNRVEFANSIDWMAKTANLKVEFPLHASNEMATYNWDIGTIQRPNENMRQFEVATHRWIDLTDKSGAYGVTILTNDKVGSDKPDDNTLRLTLMRTPGTRGGYPDQATMDWGHHELLFGLAGHEGDWRQGETDWQAYRLNKPLMAFETSKHTGFLGKNFSMLKVSDSRVRVMALKKAEAGDEVIVRLVEMSGKEEPGVRISFAAPVAAAREVNGQEQPVGPATMKEGALVASFGAYQPRTFAVKLAPPRSRVAPPVSQPVMLGYDASVATEDGRPGEGCFDCDPNNQRPSQGKALAAEMLPTSIDYAGIHFHLAPAGRSRLNAVTARGQRIELPVGKYNRLYLLAASYNGDQKAVFRVGTRPVQLTIEDWGGFIGQWDDRTWNEKKMEQPVPPEPAPNDMSPRARRARFIRAYVQEHGPVLRTEMEYTGLNPGYIKRAPVAWFASHNHNADGSNEPYSYSYLFAYAVDLQPGAMTLTLPDNPRIRILAITAAEEAPAVHPVHPLYDTLEHDAQAVATMLQRARTAMAQSPMTLTIDARAPGFRIPADFIGLSFETANLLPDKEGRYLFSAENKPLIDLFRTIGIKNLRIGGGTADGPEYAVPGPPDIDHLFGFAKAAGVKVIYTLRLLNGSPSGAAEIARYIQQHYSGQLSCFEIGNEPDWHSFHTFPSHPRDPKIFETTPGIPGTAYPSYLADWKAFATAIIHAVPGACLTGPDTGSNYPVPGTKDTDYNGTSWTEHFAQDAKEMNLRFVTQHDYSGQSATGVSIATAVKSMLSPGWVSTNYTLLYDHVLAPVESEGLSYRITECNDFTGGVDGASNAFASALWALDYMHWHAAHHAAGVNFHNKRWIYTDTIYLDRSGNFQINPKAYALKAFALGSHGTVEPLTISDPEGINLTAYAVRDSAKLFVTIINKDHGRGGLQANVTVVAKGISKRSAVMFLAAPNGNLEAKNGVTLGGASINNGSWDGIWTPLATDKVGRTAVAVPAASAAIVKLSLE